MINIVCVIGAGNIGTKVALQAAISGYRVKVFDLYTDTLKSSQNEMFRLLTQFEHSGIVPQNSVKKYFDQITYTRDPNEAVEDVDIISESIIEDVEAKMQIWEKFGKIAPAKTIFTTNTSFLLPSMFAEISGRPNKFCALHFHDVFQFRIVDIMPHPNTDRAIIPILEDFSKTLNQVPILINKENRGYIFNNLLMAFLGTAGKLLVNEVASIEDIDKSWMINFNMSKGPFGYLDAIGLDTAWRIVHTIPDRSSQAFSKLLKTYIDAGKLGEKSGEGFYQYPASTLFHDDNTESNS